MAEYLPILHVSAATHKGHVRRTNEDAIVVGDWLGHGEAASEVFELLIDDGGILLAVADGLGGHRAGEVASRFLVDRLSRCAARELMEREEDLVALLRQVDDDLRREALGVPALKGMGSTLAAAYVSQSQITIVNVGDSRVYAYDAMGGTRQLSVDHVPAAIVENGREASSPGGDVRSPGARRSSHAITQAFGGSVLRRRQLAPHFMALPVPTVPWALLICSDGLSDFVDERILLQALASMDSDADDLVEAALEAGGGDNVSVVIVRCVPASMTSIL